MAAENGEIDYPSDMLEEMQARFMHFEGRTPMAWILGLREHGKKIRTYTTNQGYIIWSDNAEVVGLKNFECSMTDFRKFVRTEVAAAQTELEALFLLHGHEAREDILPAMRLVDIKDNPAESGPDWYFIHDPRNGHLVDGSNWMLDRILDKAELQSRFFYKKKDLTWKEKEVHTYLKQVSSFMERLQLLMHVTSGQPPRGTELASIRYRNTVQGQHRNIFIENGLVTFVTQYHKGYSIDGTVKIIHRYLPKEVSELVVFYIWLILPFRQQLESLALGWEDPPSPLLWSRDHKKWDSDRLRCILVRESQLILKSTLNISIYRHVAIAMSRMHLRDYHFKRALEVENDERDLQCGHTSWLAGGIYARGIEEAPGPPVTGPSARPEPATGPDPGTTRPRSEARSPLRPDRTPSRRGPTPTPPTRTTP